MKILRFFFFILVAFIPSSTSNLIQFSREWYDSLIKPHFTPPDWIFGLIWPIWFFSLGTACFLVWEKFRLKKYVFLFLINTVLLTLWNIAFFGLKSLFLGGFLFLPILLVGALKIKTLYEIRKPWILLVLPYFVWIIFAFILNLSLISLNW